MVRVRPLRVRLGRAMVAGGITGAGIGIVAGSLTAVVLSSAAGAVLDWQHQLAFTMGVSQSLLPFGNQTGTLETVRDGWLWLVPLGALAFAIFSGAVSALAAGLVTAALNRFGAWPHMDVEVEMIGDDRVGSAKAEGDAP